MPVILDHFEKVAIQYDGCIIDLWGVVHDGRRPFAGSQEVMARLRAMGKKVCLLSNAPSKVDWVEQHLASMGVVEYDFVMTSGELVWRGLKQRNHPDFAQLGHKVHMMGYTDSQMLLEGLGLQLCQDIKEADFAWCIQTPAEDYRPMLRQMLEDDTPLICANPDLEVLFNGQLVACPGAMAQQFEQMGGKVIYRGKPFAHGYQACFDFCNSNNLAAVGDGMLTDILGAKEAGLDSYFVANGIHGHSLTFNQHGEPDSVTLGQLFQQCGLCPTATMAWLRW